MENARARNWAVDLLDARVELHVRREFRILRHAAPQFRGLIVLVLLDEQAGERLRRRPDLPAGLVAGQKAGPLLDRHVREFGPLLIIAADVRYLRGHERSAELEVPPSGFGCAGRLLEQIDVDGLGRFVVLAVPVALELELREHLLAIDAGQVAGLDLDDVVEADRRRLVLLLARQDLQSHRGELELPLVGHGVLLGGAADRDPVGNGGLLAGSSGLDGRATPRSSPPRREQLVKSSCLSFAKTAVFRGVGEPDTVFLFFRGRLPPPCAFSPIALEIPSFFTIPLWPGGHERSQVLI